MKSAGHSPDNESLAGGEIITLSCIASKSIRKRQRRILPHCISNPNLPIQYRQPRFQKKPPQPRPSDKTSLPKTFTLPIIKLPPQWQPKSSPECALTPFDCQSPAHTIPMTIHLPQDPSLQPKVSFSPPRFHTSPPTASHLQRSH